MDGRVVVITGASGGVGRATARAFGARGDRIALLARGKTGLRAAAQEIEEAGGQALPISVDTASFAGMRDAARRVEDELGPIDVWVNDAFASVFAPFMEIEPKEFRRITDVTYLGYVYGTRVALDHMLPRGRGTIVQVGSALAYRGIPLQSAYCGAKHAIKGLHESLLCELRNTGVHTTMVLLPAVNTPQFDWVRSRLPREPQPVPPIYQPELAADAILYAADHPRRREYWVGGSTVGTVLAAKLMPGLLDRYLARTGYRSQQTSEPADPDRPENLWSPADDVGGEDYGAHGRFDRRAATASSQLWASQHHGLLASIGLGVLAAAGWLFGRKASR